MAGNTFDIKNMNSVKQTKMLNMRDVLKPGFIDKIGQNSC